MSSFLPLYSAHIAALEHGYAKALEAAGFDGVVVHSGSPKKRTAYDDQYATFRPTPHFHHWAPLSESDCAVVVSPGQRAKLVRPEVTSFWEHPSAPESDDFVKALDVRSAASVESVPDALPKDRARLAFVGDDAHTAAAWGFGEAQRNPRALLDALDALRTLKSEYEIASMAVASERAARGHTALANAFASGDASELELHLLYLKATGQDDTETPYKGIVALGEHAAILHHIDYGKRPSAAGSLLVDAGATCRGYASDITRTYAKGKGASAEAFAALVSGMDALQKRICASIKPGRPYEQLHDESHGLLAVLLRESGICRVSADEVVSRGITRAFFPHGLGHSLGLQVHDVGCRETLPRAENPFLRNTSVITPGQVFTIEPGLYFIPALLAPLRETAKDAIDFSRVDALAPFGGIRIEDNVVVLSGDSEKNIRNLTREHLA